MQSATPNSKTSEPNKLLGTVWATIFAITFFGSAWLIWTSATPGALSKQLSSMEFIAFGLPLVGLWLLAVAVLTLIDLSRGFRVSIWRRWGVFSAVIVVGTSLLLRTNVTQKLGLWLSMSAFNDAVETINPALARMSNDQPIRTLGIYQVDRCLIDPRGGVYFRTTVDFVGLGPEQCSDGFVYRPNSEGTPFGDVRYEYGHLHGDWYWFRVCDD